MKKIFNVGSFSKAIVSKATFLLDGKKAYKVIIISHDDVEEDTFETYVKAKNYKDASEKAFDRYLIY